VRGIWSRRRPLVAPWSPRMVAFLGGVLRKEAREGRTLT
jgi:hypothetical protein